MSTDLSPSAATMTRRAALQRAAVFLGAALTPSIWQGALRAQTAPAAGPGAAPRYLSPGQFAAVGAVAERILPRTDTPGARDVGVPAFVDLMVGEFIPPAEKTTLLAGLAGLDQTARAAHAKPFADLAAAQQDALLTRIAEESQGKSRTFFHLIRELTIVGYFTSEPVGKNVLHYDPVPGRYDGCIPLAEVGNRSWTK